ncbi:MAG: hypothetical protein WCS87_12065 [Methylococcaceae bacterium]
MYREINMMVFIRVLFCIVITSIISSCSSGYNQKGQLYESSQSSLPISQATQTRDAALIRLEKAKVKRELAKLREEIEQAEAELKIAQADLNKYEEALRLEILRLESLKAQQNTTGSTSTGPRGGVYHYSKSGKKVYQKRH